MGKRHPAPSPASIKGEGRIREEDGPMKNIRIAAAALAFAAGAAFVRAEGGETDVKQAWMDARVKKMTDELVLTPEQQTKVRTALQSQQEKMDALRKETDQK